MRKESNETRNKVTSWILNGIIVLLGSAVVVLFFKLKQIKKDRLIPIRDGLSTVKVQILNGCGEAGLAQKVRDYLMKYQVDVRETENAGYVISETVVLDRILERGKALEVARLLGLREDHVIQQENKTLVDIDVTVIIGKDYKNYLTTLSQE